MQHLPQTQRNLRNNLMCQPVYTCEYFVDLPERPPARLPHPHRAGHRHEGSLQLQLWGNVGTSQFESNLDSIYTGWHITFVKTSRWHWCESCVLVKGLNTKAQLSNQCQREVLTNVMCYPVQSFTVTWFRISWVWFNLSRPSNISLSWVKWKSYF